jgi:hypothetical protein
MTLNFSETPRECQRPGRTTGAEQSLTAVTGAETRWQPGAPLDVDAIAARAQAAPGGSWEAGVDMLWIPWSAAGDDETDGHWSCSGRWIAVREGYWHTGSPDPGPELWAFLATARGDVLALAGEVRRLRAERQVAGRYGRALPGPERQAMIRRRRRARTAVAS